MVKRAKSPMLLLGEFWWTKTEVMRMLNTSYEAADAIFGRAKDVDDRDGINYEPKKVRQKSVLKVTGISFNELERNIKMRLVEQPQEE